jgi:hypothetical protein
LACVRFSPDTDATVATGSSWHTLTGCPSPSLTEPPCPPLELPEGAGVGALAEDFAELPVAAAELDDVPPWLLELLLQAAIARPVNRIVTSRGGRERTGRVIGSDGGRSPVTCTSVVRLLSLGETATHEPPAGRIATQMSADPPPITASAAGSE